MELKNYTHKKLDETVRLNKIDTRIKIKRADEKLINNEEVKFLLTELQKANRKKGNKAEIVIRARNGESIRTLKGYTSPDMIDDEYYNEMPNKSKFDYQYIEVTIRKNKKENK